MADEPFSTQTIRVEYTEWGEYHFFATFAVSFGYRAIPTTDTSIQINKIWADGNLWYDRETNKVWPRAKWFFMPGTEDQLPPPGAELAYRGQIVLWFMDVDIGTGGSLPAITVELQDGEDITVSDALSLISQRAGFPVEDIVISDSLGDIALLGYILDGNSTLENVAVDLAFLYDFTYYESGGTVHFHQSYVDGAFVVGTEIPQGELGVLNEGSADGQQIDTIDVGSDQSLPRSIMANYFDPDNGYQQNSQRATRHQFTASQSDVSITVPVVMLGNEMRSRLFDALARAWDERNGHSLRLPPKFMAVEPADAIEFLVYGSSYTGIVVRATLNADWSTSVSISERGADRNNADIPTQGPIYPEFPITGYPVRLVIMDVPDWEDDQDTADWLNIRFAMGSENAGEWYGARLDMAEVPNMNGWVTAYEATTDVGIGSLVEFMDADTIVIDIGNFDEARFEEVDKLLIVGSPGRFELLTFTDHEIVDGIAVLTGLDRGLFGTEIFIDTHLANDTVVFAEDTTTVKYSVSDYRSFQQYVLRPVPAFSFPEDQDTFSWRPQGNSRRPYAPLNVEAFRQPNGDVNFKWIRQDRFEGEPDNVYSMDIFNADWTQLIRRINNITRFNVIYTIEDQTTDGTNLATTHNILVYQLNASHVGRGFPGGGAIVEDVQPIELEAHFGPVAGLRVQPPLAAVFGPVVGIDLLSDPAWGAELIELDAVFGPVGGMVANLTSSPWAGRFGPVAGLSVEIAAVEQPGLGSRSARFVSGTATAEDLNLPTLAYGDVLIFHELISMFTAANDAIPSHNGWNLLGTNDQRLSNGFLQRVYYYVVEEPEIEPATKVGYTGFVNKPAWYFGEVYRMQRVDMVDPIVDFAFAYSAGSTSNHTAPSVTTENTNDLVLSVVGALGNTRTYSSPTGELTFDGFVNSKTDQTPSSFFGGDNGGTVAAAYFPVEVAGVSGAVTFPYSIARPYMGFSVALKYAPQETGSPNQEHRYWEVLIDNDTGAGGIQIRELQFIQFNSDGVTGTGSASSGFGGFAAQNAFDGNEATSWATSSFGGGHYPEWIRLDLGEGNAANINALNWLPIGGGPSDDFRQPLSFHVRWSDDETNWTTVYDSASDMTSIWHAGYNYFSWGPVEINLAATFGPVTGFSAQIEPLPTSEYLYWRVHVTEMNGGGTFLDVSEIEFRQAGVDQATGGTASASSVASSFVASNAFDNNLSTRWVSVGAMPQWIRYQFAAPIEIDAVSIHISNNGSNRSPRDFTIEASADGSSWTTIHTVIDEPGWANSAKVFSW